MKFRLTIIWVISTLLTLTFSNLCFAVAGITWSGAFEVDITYQELNDSSPPGSPETILNGSLDLKMDINSGEKQSGFVLFKYEYQSVDENESQDFGSLSIYQAYLDLLLNESSLLRLGRQKISWGGGFAWNPTNYIGADKNRADLEAENPGVDTINFEITHGNSSGILAFKPQNDWNDWYRAVKLNWRVWHSDLALSGYQRNEDNAFGIDYATSIGNFTVYSEIASKTGTQWYIDNNSEKNRADSDRYLHGVVGLNGYFNNNWMVLLEYFCNQEGWNDQEATNYVTYSSLLSPMEQGILRAKKRDLFGELRRNYLDMMIKKSEIAEDLSLSINVLYNLDDNSYLFTPELDYQFAQNALFKLMFNYFKGDNQSEFGLMNNQFIIKFILSF